MSQTPFAKEAINSRPKLLMVTSYRRSCGIAQYVEFLEQPLRDQSKFDLEIAALPVDLFRAEGPYAKTASRQIFNEILEKAKLADVVAIQLEPGLFGISPFGIWRRIRQLFIASKKIIIIYHTVPAMQSVKPNLSLRGLKDFISSIRGKYIFNNIFKAVRKDPKKFRHLVQTKREANNFELLGLPAETIQFEPLSFLTEAVKNELIARPGQRHALAQRYGVDNGVIIGCFGFLSSYKGIEVAVRAMRHLPNNYHLLIVGGLHPEGIARNTVEQPYIMSLLDELEGSSVAQGQPNIIQRVHFCGALPNDEFNEVMAACDAVVLPYAEVGQTSSGPAALALDLQKGTYCSRTHCFKELDRYQPGSISFFEIGNHLELAQKLILNEAQSSERIDARRSYSQKHNVEKRAGLYISAASSLVGHVA
ncbi:hypothetical protein ACI3KW_00045 [Devosia sp. ZW T5_3]|uniref:hypothetical protein n=1 Tax=Devosia sp. ZW T5_3 TaxID=3378085 RepID=UPI0038545D48